MLCSMWRLLGPGRSNPFPLYWQVHLLNHWTTREVLPSEFMVKANDPKILHSFKDPLVGLKDEKGDRCCSGGGGTSHDEGQYEGQLRWLALGQ